jgi:hypothetical protein
MITRNLLSQESIMNLLGGRQPQQIFRLLDLPPELILHILELFIDIDLVQGPINIADAFSGPKSAIPFILKRGEARYTTRSRRLLQPAISRTCRLFRSETLPLFYQRNVFFLSNNFEGDRAIVKWLGCIGIEHVRQLRSVLVRASVGIDGGYWLHVRLWKLSTHLESKTSYILHVPIVSNRIVLNSLFGFVSCRIIFCQELAASTCFWKTMLEVEGLLPRRKDVSAERTVLCINDTHAEPMANELG